MLSARAAFLSGLPGKEYQKTEKSKAWDWVPERTEDARDGRGGRPAVRASGMDGVKRIRDQNAKKTGLRTEPDWTKAESCDKLPISFRKKTGRRSSFPRSWLSARKEATPRGSGNPIEGENGMVRRKVYLWILAALLAALTVLLSAAAIRIWQEGSVRKAENPLEPVYTPENVEAEFLRISPILFAVIGMAAAGLLLGIRDEKSLRPVSSPEAERDLLAFRLEKPGEAIRRERKKQQAIRWIRGGAFALCMAPVVIYCADRGHFPEKDLEGMIASLALHTVPWVAAGLGILLAGLLLEKNSIRREIDAARAQLKTEKSGQPALASAGAHGLSDRGVAAARIVLLGIAAALIVLGVLNGSMKDVLLKAINICTECIGLG